MPQQLSALRQRQYMFGVDPRKWHLYKRNNKWHLSPPTDTEERRHMVMLGQTYEFDSGAQALEAFRRGQ